MAMSDDTETRAKGLARLLKEELDRDGWGDLDPSLLEIVASGEYDEDLDNEIEENAEALFEVLCRVVDRLSEIEDDA